MTRYLLLFDSYGLILWGALSDERTGLSFVYAASSCQSSVSWVWVPWDSRPYFTVSDLRLSFSSPPCNCSEQSRAVAWFVTTLLRRNTCNWYICNWRYIAFALTAQITSLYCCKGVFTERLPRNCSRADCCLATNHKHSSYCLVRLHDLRLFIDRCLETLWPPMSQYLF
jgi:hypothetical protein